MISQVTTPLADWRRAPTQLVGLLALAVTVAVFLWQLPHFLAGNSTIWPQYASAFTDMLFYTAWGFAVLLALTAFTRTVPLRLLVAFWFLGVFAVHGLVVAIELTIPNSTGLLERAIWIAPVVETLVVLAVIVGFYALATFRRGTHPTVSDGLLVGFATGVGLAFHEDMTYGRVMAIGPGAEYTVVGRMGQDIWWSYVFPLVGWQGLFHTRQFGNGVVGNFALYHAGWATLVGVGVGFVFVHRHRILAWLAGLFAVAVTYFDHMSGNFSAFRPLESPPVVGDLFQAGDATGVSEFSVYVLLVAIGSAIATDLLVLRRVASHFDAFPPVHRALRVGQEQADDAGTTRETALRRLRGLEVYARTRRAFLTAVYRVEASHTDSRRLVPSASALYETGRTAGLLAAVGLVVGTGLAILAIWMSTSVGAAAVGTDSLVCAGCAPSNAFVGPLVSLLGGGAAVVATVAMLRLGTVSASSGAAYADPKPPNAEYRYIDASDLSTEERGELLAGSKQARIEKNPHWKYDWIWSDSRGSYLGPVKYATTEIRVEFDGGSAAVERIYISDGRLFVEVDGEHFPLHPDATLEFIDRTTSPSEEKQLYPGKTYEELANEEWEANRQAASDWSDPGSHQSVEFEKQRNISWRDGSSADVLKTGMGTGIPDTTHEGIGAWLKLPLAKILSIWDMIGTAVDISNKGDEIREKWKLPSQTDETTEPAKDSQNSDSKENQ